jgi:transposase
MSATFVNVDRRTPLLLPPDLRDWVPEDDLVHFVLAAVEGMDLQSLGVNHRGSGSAQYPPSMMLALLIYCYANGVFGSRRIERASYRDVAVRYLSGDTHPDHDTICKFRRENFDAVAECFVKVLELARELKLLKVGTVSVDGTQLRANASRHKNVTYERAGELSEQLENEVRELLGQAEEADRSTERDGQQLPEEIARREALREKLDQARQRLEERARKRAESEQAEYERKCRARESREGSRKGRHIKPPDDTPRADEQANLIDGDSRLMRKNKRSSFEQCYNAQAVVDAEGSQLVLGTRVSTCASDRNELVADVDQIPLSAGPPSKVLADSGYACEEQVNRLQDQQIEVYVSTGAESIHQHRQHDLRPRHRRRESAKEPKAPWLLEMKEKLQTEEARALYALRKQTVEPVFGIIKQVMGFRQFLLRGHEKVSGEWELVSLAYNMKRLWNLKQALAGA